MGTTVSTNLGLIKPDIDESIKEALPTFAGWPAQNSINMDKIDALFRASTGIYTVNLTADIANPTLGAGGFTEGKWVRLYPRMVIVFFRIYAGVAGFAAGNGDYRINLPFAVDPVLDASDSGRGIPIGKCAFKDNSAVLTSSAFLVLYDAVNDVIIFELSQGDIFASSYPFSTDDRLSGYFMYPTAVA
ncbi:MAG: hypothetical protein HMLIMOIP_002086 [Candidatus Nitrosomirales archaeon]|jgi:hypothetical protein